ncbi:MAG: GNAT family N-acetyltransferase [bacterium]|nr:GNAT family N-acetyltransferase [bacterium]
MSQLEVKHRATQAKGLFYIEDEGKTVASLHYVFAGESRIIIDHTEVDATYGGKGLGARLIEAVVNFAREGTLKIMPLCPYAKKVMERTAEYSDVLF